MKEYSPNKEVDAVYVNFQSLREKTFSTIAIRQAQYVESCIAAATAYLGRSRITRVDLVYPVVNSWLSWQGRAATFNYTLPILRVWYIRFTRRKTKSESFVTYGPDESGQPQRRG